VLPGRTRLIGRDGLDTLADVYLNGRWLGHTENMFRQYSWEVKDLLKKVRTSCAWFGGPVTYITAKQKKNRSLAAAISRVARTCARRPASSAGIGAPSCRPSASGKISAWKATATARFDDIYLRQRIEQDKDDANLAPCLAESAVDAGAAVI
jgi:beta-mannosidase